MNRINSSLTLILKLIKRTIHFLFSFSFVMLMLFISGNYQQFLDANQQLIMKICVFSISLLVIFEMVDVIVIIIFLFTEKEIKKYFYFIFRIISSVLISTGGIIFIYLLRTIDIFSSGIK